ncbi:MAG: bifunctional riboflavin kinase/FAD synthetase [Actinobacteria bacterium]|nr:bifunctional riboflavin kinase/FAD synthetase [Actinomycetota bacterium]
MARKLKLKDISKGQFSGLDPVMVIGFFDGVHKGHQKVINMCKDSSREKGTASVVLTFDKPPLNVVKSRNYKKLILPFEKKIKILDSMGIDFIISASINTEFLKLSPESFCRDILLGLFEIKELFVGEGFRFGYRASGDIGLLKKYLEPAGVKVNEVKLLSSDEGEVISSTTIRNHYAKGNISMVRKLLGRDPYITGRVVRGAGRGRGIGFPTANLDIRDTLVVPGDGVYFGTVSIIGEDGSRLPAVINIGDNPTFNDLKKNIETYIIDFSKNIYNMEIRIEFLKRHRYEVKFKDGAELTEQIRNDIDEARLFFNEEA